MLQNENWWLSARKTYVPVHLSARKISGFVVLVTEKLAWGVVTIAFFQFSTNPTRFVALKQRPVQVVIRYGETGNP
jgi:hypothetical protein